VIHTGSLGTLSLHGPRSIRRCWQARETRVRQARQDFNGVLRGDPLDQCLVSHGAFGKLARSRDSLVDVSGNFSSPPGVHERNSARRIPSSRTRAHSSQLSAGAVDQHDMDYPHVVRSEPSAETDQVARSVVYAAMEVHRAFLPTDSARGLRFSESAARRRSRRRGTSSGPSRPLGPSAHRSNSACSSTRPRDRSAAA
jgi:hypothetical protein